MIAKTFWRGLPDRMRPVESIREVTDAVNAARTNAPEYCSNFFPAPPKLQGWITRGELFCDQRGGVNFFWRKDRGFWHLYFCAASPALLQQSVTALPLMGTEPVVLDLVGKEPALADMVGRFVSAGFHIHSRLLRMARSVPSAEGGLKSASDSRVVLAGPTDCQPVLDLLMRSFDCRAEQIPALNEIEAAVAARQILVVHCADTLAGLLFFETQGLSSLLRYWLVESGFRSQNFGSGLMRQYFAEHPSVRRFLLWVVASNRDAIGKYEHYGFAPEGLVDYVLANDKIRL